MEICNSTSREPKIAILRKFDELQKNTDNSTSQENNTGKNWEVSQGETQILELNNIVNEMKNVTRASATKQFKRKKNVRSSRQDLQNYPVQGGKEWRKESEESLCKQRREKEAESLLKEIMAENFQNLKDIWTSKFWSSQFIKQTSREEILGFPGSTRGKEPVNAGDMRDVGWIPGSGRSHEGRHGNSLQYSCLENPHG